MNYIKMLQVWMKAKIKFLNLIVTMIRESNAEGVLSKDIVMDEVFKQVCILEDFQSCLELVGIADEYVLPALTYCRSKAGMSRAMAEEIEELIFAEMDEVQND